MLRAGDGRKIRAQKISERGGAAILMAGNFKLQSIAFSLCKKVQ
jgi:hypothetical protein